MTTDSLAQRLSQAIALHRQGELAQAATLYRQILDESPDTVPALTNLGSILRQAGQLDQAIELLQRAVAQPGSNLNVARIFLKGFFVVSWCFFRFLATIPRPREAE